MAGGRPSAGRAGGGAGIPSLRPSRTRLIAATAAVAVTAGIGAYTAATGGRLALLGQSLAYAGAAILAVAAATRLAQAIPWAIALAGTGYVTGRVGHGTADGFAAVVGTGLLLAAELAGWAGSHDRRIAEERRLLVHRVTLLACLVAASLLIGFVLVGAAALSAPAGILLSGVGMAAAIAAVGVILRLLRGAPAAEEPRALRRR